MVLPFFLFLLILTLQIGMLSAKQCEVVVQARLESWRKARLEGGGRPLYFVAHGHVAPHVEKRAYVLSPILPARMSTARAEHFVLGGSWDYHALPMNSPPEVVTMIEMALIAKTSKYLVGLSGLGAKLSKLRVYAEKVKGWLNENWGSKLSGQKKDVDRARTESDSRPFQGREFSEEAEEAEKKIKELKDGLNDVEREMKERIKEDKKKIEDLEKLIVDLKQKWVEADDSVRISLQAQLQSCEADKKRAACRAAAIAWADQMVRQNAEFYSSQIQAATEEIEKIKDHMVDIAKEYTPDDQDP